MRRRETRKERSRESGNAIILAFFILVFLFGLAMAQVLLTHKNVQASSFFNDHAELRRYAESGIQLALEDMTGSLSGNNGNIGTVAWVVANDVGRDGVGGTGDDGEGDGIPTIGEPNVVPVAVGESHKNAGLAVHVFPGATPDVARVVSTVSNGNVWSTVDCYARQDSNVLPRVGAIYVSKGVELDLRGSFRVDGRDHDLDGDLSGGADFPGIATDTADPAGSNLTYLLTQIEPKNYGKVKGLGGSPSVAETTLDFPSLFDRFSNLRTQVLEPGTYTDLVLGDRTDVEVTYVKGDLHISGSNKGCGILVVEGSLTITGSTSFEGLVLVSGDIKASGTGSEMKVLGSLLVGQSIANVDTETSAKSTGAAAISYSSEALDLVEGSLSRRWAVVHYDDR